MQEQIVRYYCQRVDDYDRWTMYQRINAYKKCSICSLYYTNTNNHSYNDNTEKYLINLIKYKANLSRFTLTADLKLCDGALIIVPVNINNWDWLTMAVNVAANQFVTPIFLIDLQLNESKNYIQTFKQIEEVVNKILKIVSEIGDKKSQWKNTRTITIDNFIFSDIENQWSFTVEKYMQFYKNSITQIKQQKKQIVKEQFQISKQRLQKEHSFQIKSKQQPENLQKLNNMRKQVLQNIIQFLACKFNQCLQTVTKNNPNINQQQQLHKKALKQLNTWICSNFKGFNQIMHKIINKINSPLVNQKYKYDTIIYNPKNEQQDEISISIKQCKSTTPLIIFISKSTLIPTYSSNSYNYLIGKIYSGVLKNGEKVRIISNCADSFNMNIDKNISTKETLCQCFIASGTKLIPLSQIGAGNIVVLRLHNFHPANIQHIITSLDVPQQQLSFKRLFFPIIPLVLKASVAPKQPAQLPKLVQSIKKLIKCQPVPPQLQYQIHETGDHVLKFTNSKILHHYIKQLQNQGCAVDVSQIYQQYRESVLKESSQLVQVKSPNKHNRLFGSAQPIDQKSKQAINVIQSKYRSNTDFREIYGEFRKSVGWDQKYHGIVWTFGQYIRQNMLVDNLSHSQQSKRQVNQIRQAMLAAFEWSTKQGPICQQKVMGVRYNLLDCQLISDAIHRGGGQIIPTSRRLFYAAHLLANPVILQPIISCVVLVQLKQLKPWVQHCNKYGIAEDNIKYQIQSKTYFIQNQIALETKQTASNINSNIKNNVVVNITIPAICWSQNIFDMDVDIQSIVFNWKQVQGNIFQEGSRANQIAKAIRARKSLNQNLPDVSNYIDRL